MKSDDIDALARLLDGDLDNGEAPAEARALGAFAKALEGSAATPTFAGKADLRAMLVEAAREQAAAPTLLARMRGSVSSATARWRYSTRLAAATGASAMALSTGGVALAAQQATPGHPLYGVKLVLEEGHLWFIGDQVERGEQRLANATERLDEARTAAEAGDMAGAAQALRESDDSSRRGAGDIIAAAQGQGDPSILDILTTFSAEQRERLRALEPLLAGDASKAADDALVALNRIDQRVAVLGGTCGSCDEEAQSGNGKGKGTGKGDKNDAEQQDSSSAGDVVVADARDFDFTEIPPADEPFSPCPCATTPTGTPANTGTAGDEVEDEVDEADEKPNRKPPKDDKPGDEDPADEEPGDEDPGPVPAPVGEATEKASEIIDEVIDQLPGDPPDTPETPDLPPIPPPPTDGVNLPDAPELP